MSLVPLQHVASRLSAVSRSVSRGLWIAGIGLGSGKRSKDFVCIHAKSDRDVVTDIACEANPAWTYERSRFQRARRIGNNSHSQFEEVFGGTSGLT